jgi:hypothetical protein
LALCRADAENEMRQGNPENRIKYNLIKKGQVLNYKCYFPIPDPYNFLQKPAGDSYRRLIMIIASSVDHGATVSQGVKSTLALTLSQPVFPVPAAHPHQLLIASNAPPAVPCREPLMLL